MADLLLRFDMRNPDFGADRQSLYDAALDMAQWADEQGFDCIQISEHHGSADHYLPSPMILAAAMAARTKRIKLRLSLVILTLHDPLRVAEDIAVLDIVSNGRLEVVVGAGYVPSEFAMFDKSLKDRGQLMERNVLALKQAWTGEPFAFDGRTVTVTPTPAQKPHPPLWMGGSSAPAARRAARLADYFYSENAELFAHFAEERSKHGKPPVPFRQLGTGFLVACEDPEAEWQRMAPYILHECNSYGEWQASSSMQGQYVQMQDIEPLKAMGLYPILSAEDTVAHIQGLTGDNDQICLHPLISGQDPENGWRQLRYFADKVMPAIR